MDLSFSSLKAAWTDVSGSLAEAGDAFKSLVMDDFSQPMPAPSPYNAAAHNYKPAQQSHQAPTTTGNHQPVPGSSENGLLQQNRNPSGQHRSQNALINQSPDASKSNNVRPNIGIQQTQQPIKQHSLRQWPQNEQRPLAQNHHQGQKVYEPYYAPSPNFPSVSDQIRAALAKSAAPKSTGEQKTNDISNDAHTSTHHHSTPYVKPAMNSHVSEKQNTPNTMLPQYYKPTSLIDEHNMSAAQTTHKNNEQQCETNTSNELNSLPQYYKPTPFVAHSGQNAVHALQGRNDRVVPTTTSEAMNSLPTYYKPTPLASQQGISAISGVLYKDGHSKTNMLVATPNDGILKHYPQVVLSHRSKSTSDLNRTKSVPDLQRADSTSGFSNEHSSFQKTMQHKPIKTRSSWQDLNLHKSTPDLRRCGISPGPGYESPGAVVLSRRNSVGSRPRAWRSLSRGPTPSQERERTESEKAEIQKQLEAEIRELKSNLNQIHTAEDKMEKKEKPREDLLQSLKKELEQLRSENRSLRSSLTEAQTNLVLSRSELVTLKSDFEEQNGFISNNRDVIQDYIGEQENLTRQLQLLHGANKKLQDTNDDLRAALDNVSRSSRMSPRTTRLLSSASYMNDYMDDDVIVDPSRQRKSYASQGSYDGSEMQVAGGRRHFAYHTTDGDNYPDDGALIQQSGARKLLEDFLDSGNSTLRDPNELDSETEEDLRRAPPLREEIAVSMKQEMKDAQRQASHQHTSQATSSQQSTSSKGASSMGLQTSHYGEPIRNPHSLSRGSSPRSSAGGSRKRALPPLPQKPLSPTPSAPPERMYKIVLAGDAAVGKSSFIMRLCKGIFHNNLNSTLGVDFQMKTIDVDDRVTSLQLWDTAGQERFRSIAKSYFRRADGVLLLYDCTCERSFINVRDWIEAIEVEFTCTHLSESI